MKRFSSSSKSTRNVKTKTDKMVLKYQSFNNGLFQIVDPGSIDLVEHWSSFKNHADNPQPDQVNRIQNLLVLQSENVDSQSVRYDEKNQTVPKEAISRNTAFIPGSHLCPELFQTYYVTYLDEKANVSACPGFLIKLKLNIFNEELHKLRNLISSGMEENHNDSNALHRWYRALISVSKVSQITPTKYMEEIPEQFCYFVSQLQAGDLVLFMPGVIHSVLDSTNPQILRIKISTELSTSSTRDLEISAGSYKKAAREFEKSHLDLVQSINHTLLTEDEKQGYAAVSVTFRDSELKQNGVTIIQKVIKPRYTVKLFKHCALYLQRLMKLPGSIDFTDPVSASIIHNKEKRLAAGVSDGSIRRQPGNSRSTIIPKDHGISGIGYESIALKELYNLLSRAVFSQVYTTMFGDSTHVIKDIGIHFQAPY